MDRTAVELAKEYKKERKISIKKVASYFNIHRSSLYITNKVVSMDKYKFYKKKEDDEVLDQIQEIVVERPSYGYKRITALINKKRVLQKLPPYNKKRVLRVMRINGLILPKNGAQTIKRAKTGKVMTLKSNTRWCSDCFEIKCHNREKVYVTFVLDTCDREVIAWRALKRPVKASDLTEMMANSVYRRFANYKTPHRIQFLSDRGAIYRSFETQLTAREIGLKSCFTSAYSPESNGMAEAFVGRFKKDYVYVNDCLMPEQVIKNIDEWMEDYNNFAPHSALNMRSPREFIKSIQV